jgi:hypothetical protein
MSLFCIILSFFCSLKAMKQKNILLFLSNLIATQKTPKKTQHPTPLSTRKTDYHQSMKKG